MGYEQENTLASCLRAIDLACDEIETDAWLHRGALVISHDPPGPDDTLTLEELLETCRDRVTVNVEVKARRSAQLAHEAGAHVATVIRDRHTDAYLSSFWWPALAAARRAAPEVRRAYIFASYEDPGALVRRARALGLWALHPAHVYVTPELVRAAHSAGLAVNAWTANDPEDIAALVELGVDGIASDYPDRVPKG